MDPASKALAPRAADGATCPKGTSFYKCDGNDFSGCCSVDPCDLRTCPDGGDEATASAPVTLPNLLTSTTTKSTTKHTSKTTKKSTSTEEASSTSSAAAKGTPTSTITASTSKRTDSGITHTIPNSSVVTVTRHTTIFSEAPSSTQIPSSTETLLFSEPPSFTTLPADQSTGIAYDTTTATPAASSSPPAADGTAGSVSSGTIVAVSVGGAACAAIIIVLIWGMLQRRRKQRLLGEAQTPPDFVLSVASSGHGPSRDDGSAAEKYARPSQHMPSHAMGRPANADPFAPFGGRVDRPRNRHPSGPGEYEMSGIAVSSPVEMDGRGAAPAELPAELPAEPATPMSPARTRHAVGGAARPHSYHPYSPGCVPNSPAKDPRANLSSIRTESGRAGYVNQWDQWRALGTGGSGCGNGRASDTAGDGRS